MFKLLYFDSENTMFYQNQNSTTLHALIAMDSYCSELLMTGPSPVDSPPPIEESGFLEPRYYLGAQQKGWYERLIKALFGFRHFSPNTKHNFDLFKPKLQLGRSISKTILTWKMYYGYENRRQTNQSNLGFCSKYISKEVSVSMLGVRHNEEKNNSDIIISRAQQKNDSIS